MKVNKIYLILNLFSLIAFNISCSQSIPSAEERIQQATDSLELDSLNYYQLVIRADAFKELKMYDSALIDVNKAISVIPKNDFWASRTYILRGDLYFYFKDYRKALEDYDEAIRLKPDDPYAYLSRGILKCKIGDNSCCDDLKIAKEIGYSETDVFDEYCN